MSASMPSVPRELTPRFPDAVPFLGRFLPDAPAVYWGLHTSFCDLHAFLRHLHTEGWYGYLHVAQGGPEAFALVLEGRVVAAACGQNMGDAALSDLLNLFTAGAALSAYALEADIAHALSGVGNRAWKFDLTDDFTGLHASTVGAVFYAGGELVATIPVKLPYEGAFPAPLRPQTLLLPKSLAGWAHQNYALTLRGKDALNPITVVHQHFRAQFGVLGTEAVRALAEGLTPAEYASRSDVPLHDLEGLVSALVQGGFVRAGT